MPMTLPTIMHDADIFRGGLCPVTPSRFHFRLLHLLLTASFPANHMTRSSPKTLQTQLLLYCKGWGWSVDEIEHSRGRRPYSKVGEEGI